MSSTTNAETSSHKSRSVSLDVVEIPSPCTMDWELMTGDDRVRFCDKCQKNVYNLSALTRQEATDLISRSEKLCTRLHRRPDGTVVTNECPPAPERRWRPLQFSISALLILMTSSATLVAASPWIGKKISPLLDHWLAKPPVASPLMGNASPLFDETIGEFAMPLDPEDEL